MSHNLKSYIIGYILSLVLTVEAYLMVVNQTFSPSVIIYTVLGLAIVQLLVQLFFFLHLNRAVRAPWNIIVLLFMGMVVAIIVFGSLWIMHNLNYNMSHKPMTPAETERYMQRHEGF